MSDSVATAVDVDRPDLAAADLGMSPVPAHRAASDLGAEMGSASTGAHALMLLGSGGARQPAAGTSSRKRPIEVDLEPRGSGRPGLPSLGGRVIDLDSSDDEEEDCPLASRPAMRAARPADGGRRGAARNSTDGPHLTAAEPIDLT